MLTTMPAAESPGFASSFFTRPGLTFVGSRQPCFKMKTNSDWDAPTQYGNGVNNSCNGVYDDEMADLLERIELVELDYDDELIKTDTEWMLREATRSKRASKHLSGGGLVPEGSETTFVKSETLSNFSGGAVVSTTQPLTSSANATRVSRNPFKNHIKLVLDAEEKEGNTPSEGCALPATNPFSVFHDSSLSDDNLSDLQKKTPSQCSTRPVSPTNCQDPNPFAATPRPNSCLFVFPTPATVNQSTQTASDPPWLFNDFHCLQSTMKALRLSGWYYENVSWQDSVHLLHNTEPGTFLVRDSADPNFLFSLSVQTPRGPTSVRLHYVNGRFRLDADDNLICALPSFESVHDLVEHYIINTEVHSKKRHKSRRKSTSAKEQVWVDSRGQVYSSIRLTSPLRKSEQITLQHISRLAAISHIRKCYRSGQSRTKSNNSTVPIIDLINQLPVPQSVIDYLVEYPFSE